MKSNRQTTYLGNNAPLYVEDRALWVMDAHQDANRAAFGEVLVASLSPRAAWRFDYGSAPNTRLYTANGGTATQSASQLLLQTSANAAGLTRMQTRRRLRYLPGMGGLVRFTAVFDSPADNSSQLIGIGDTADGFFFGYKGAAFGVIRRRAGVDDFTDAADWNGVPVDVSPQRGNVYQIRYQWLGYGYIRFYILDPDFPSRGFVLAHSIPYPDSAVVTSILNPTLPLFAEVLNNGNASNVTLITPSALAALEGAAGLVTNPLDVANSAVNLATLANTSNNHLLTIRNKATFGGSANRVPVRLINLTLGRSQAGAALSRIRLYRNATTAGALTYADIDTANSPVEASTTTTTITSTNPERTYLLSDQGTGALYIPIEGRDVVLEPGESLSIGVENSGVQSTETAATLNWVEEF